MTAVAQWLRCCATRSLVRTQLMSMESFIDIKSFWLHYGPGTDSASNRNEYQEHLLGCKGGRCVRLTTLPSSRVVVMKSGNLNFLETSGPLQVCNETALPLPLQISNDFNTSSIQYTDIHKFPIPKASSPMSLYHILQHIGLKCSVTHSSNPSINSGVISKR